MAESIHTLTTWDKATTTWDDQSPGDSLNWLLQIQHPNSKILYNIGCAQLRLGNTAQAEQTFTSVIAKDEHMAIAYFQRGCVLVKANRLRDAVCDFEECQKHFRGQSVIDYGQLGLKYKLYMCEAKYNCGVAEARRGDMAAAEQHIEKALKTKVELRHKSITDSLQALKNGKTPSLIEVPHCAIYRPPKGKVANLAHKDYLGKSKVISAVDHDDEFSGFVGPKKVEEQRRLSPNVSPGGSPNAERQAQRSRSPYPLTPSPGREPLPLPSKEQLVETSRDLSPKLKRLKDSQNGKSGSNQRIHHGSRDDTFLKLPPGAAPFLPPKGDRLRRGSEGILRIAEGILQMGVPNVSTKLPPPPSRPPPKLDRKPLPQLPDESDNHLPAPKQAAEA